MERLKSPLTEDELKKIDRFYIINKNYLTPQQNITNLDAFIKENGIFLNVIENLTDLDKSKAWVYLFKLSSGGKKSKNKINSSGFSLTTKQKFSVLILVLILIIFAFILYKCSPRGSDDSSPKPISEYVYTKYTKDQFPRLYENWGEDWVIKIAELERQAVYKIASEHNSCDSIEMAALSENKSTPKKEAVFFIDCANGERFYVSQNDLGSDVEIRSQTEKAVNQSDAYDQCVEMVKLNAKYPSTVNFKMLDSNGFTAKTTGNVVINLSFDAKNSFGAELPAKARCVFTPDGEKEINITEG